MLIIAVCRMTFVQCFIQTGPLVKEDITYLQTYMHAYATVSIDNLL